MKHLWKANNYKFLKYQNGTWINVDSLELKKNDFVKVFDADTGEQLETEHGDCEFRLMKDFDSTRKLPLFY